MVSVCTAFGQHRISGKITTESGEPVAAVVSLYASDTLAGVTLADTQGMFEFIEVRKGDYLLLISDTAYQIVSDSLTLNSDLNRRYVLVRQISLDEVTVVADRSKVVQQTANGTIFHLSSSAKKADNAFAALNEIPLLVVDETNRNVKMNSGYVPLILINGLPKANGLNGVDPADMESVEVITVPSARYAGSVEAVVNVKVARKKYGYRSLNAYSRHSLPVMFGVSGLNTETGDAKWLIYLSGQHFYFNDDETHSLNSQRNGGYSKNSETTGLYNSNSYYGSFGGDYVFSENDYMSYSVTYISNPLGTKQTGNGELASGDVRSAFDISTNNENRYYIHTYNVLYAHDFQDESRLETTFRLNFNGDGSTSERRETYDNRPEYYYLSEYDNFRTSSSFDLNYSFKLLGQSFDAGSKTNFRKDKINNITYPVFNYRELDEYLYLGATGSLNKYFSYMASIGSDLIFNRSGDINNSYYSLTASASLTYKADSHNSIRLSYLKNNEAPNIGYMNPYNTSTDSLYVSVGNPYLRPARIQRFTFGYTFNKNGIYFSPQVVYRTISDYVLLWGSNDGNVYTQTYINDKHINKLEGMITLSYNSKWGSIGCTEGYNHTYYSNVDNGAFYTSIYFNARYKKMSVNGNVYFKKYSRAQYSTTRNYAPESEITFGWSPNSIITLNAGMRYFLGGLKSETNYGDNGYRTYSMKENLDRRYLVMLGLNINLKSKVQKNRMEKRLYQNESGIQLK
jgi:hypothetical protein